MHSRITDEAVRDPVITPLFSAIYSLDAPNGARPSVSAQLAFPHSAP